LFHSNRFHRVVLSTFDQAFRMGDKKTVGPFSVRRPPKNRPKDLLAVLDHDLAKIYSIPAKLLDEVLELKDSNLLITFRALAIGAPIRISFRLQLPALSSFR